MKAVSHQWNLHLIPLGNKVDSSFVFIAAYRVVKAERVAPAGHTGIAFDKRKARWHLTLDENIHLPNAELLTVVRKGVYPMSVSVSLWRGHVYNCGLEKNDIKT